MSAEFWFGLGVALAVIFIALLCIGVREYIKQSNKDRG